MTIKDTQTPDFVQAFSYICTLCGFPAVQPDKAKVMIDFLKYNHGRMTLDEFQDAFIALAAGRLDEKLENIKSLTGMSASRVILAWRRIEKKDEKPDNNENRERVNEENKIILHDKFGVWVHFSDEVTKEQADYLLDYWINVNRESYLKNKRVDLLTTTAYDRLIARGELRKTDAGIQVWENETYDDLLTNDECERGGRRLKQGEDAIMNAVKSLSRIRKDDNNSIECAVKRYIVGVYYDYKSF